MNIDVRGTPAYRASRWWGLRLGEFVGRSLPVVRAYRLAQDRTEDDHRRDLRFIGEVRPPLTAVLEDEEWTLRESLMTPQ